MYKRKFIRSIAAVLSASVICNVPLDIKAITKSEQERLECNRLLKNKRTGQNQQNKQKIEDVQDIVHEYENILKLKELNEKKNNASEFLELDLAHDELVENPKEKIEEIKRKEQQMGRDDSYTKKKKHSKKQKNMKKGKPYQEVLLSGVESLSTEEKRKVKKVKEKARKDASSSAEQINKFEGNTFYVAVKEVLDEYYEDKDNIQKEKIAEFKESVDAKAENLIEGYEAALEERQCAETLDYETEQIMVAFKEGTPYEEVQAITDCLGGEIDILDGTNRELTDYMQDGNQNLEDTLVAKINIGVGQTVDMAKESLEEIACIEAVEPNKYKQVESVSTELTNDPYINQQYYLEQINVDGAWNAIANALGYCDYETNRAVIAIIDTGFDVAHSDLKNVLSNKSITTGEIDANGNFKSLFNCDIPYYSDHGSHVAGIIAAQTNNGSGIVGITNVYDQENNQYFNTCEIIGINAGKSSGTGAVISTAREIDGIYYAINQGADVINMSYGGDSSDSVYEAALSAAHEAGVVLVAAAGNENTNAPCYPAHIDNVISVAALKVDGKTRRDTSNFGEKLDISAPGTNIYSCVTGSSEIKSKSGTSMAAPMVTSAVALMRAVNKELTPEEIESILYTTATDLETTGRDDYTGYGRVNIGMAVLRAKSMRYNETNKRAERSAMCLKSDGTYSNFINFEVNPVVDKYYVYRSEEQGKLGECIAILGHDEVVNDGSEMLCIDLDVEQGTYYYSVIGVIFDGNEIYNAGYVMGPSASSSLEIDCSVPDISIWPSYSYVNNIFISYDGEYDNFIVSRSENSNLTSSNSFFSDSYWFHDTTGEKGKTYYYQALAFNTTEDVTYFSDDSNVTSMIIE